MSAEALVPPECQRRESCTSTDPAVATICISPGIGECSSTESSAPRGLRRSLCVPGTTHAEACVRALGGRGGGHESDRSH